MGRGRRPLLRVRRGVRAGLVGEPVPAYPHRADPAALRVSGRAGTPLVRPGGADREVRLRRVIEWTERTKLLFGSDLDKASGAFERHGGKAILIGHLIPGVGALISVPAGLKRMPILGRFLGYTVLGTTSWTGSLVGLGWALGRRWRLVEFYASFIAFGVLAALVLGILWVLWRRWGGPKLSVGTR